MLQLFSFSVCLQYYKSLTLCYVYYGFNPVMLISVSHVIQCLPTPLCYYF